MNDDDTDRFLVNAVRRLRVIHLALVGGVVMMAVTLTSMHFLAFDGKPLAKEIPNLNGISLLTIFAGFIAASALLASIVVGGLFRKQVVQRVMMAHKTPSAADGPALLVGWQGLSLIRIAMLEAPAILALIVFLLTGDFAALGIALVMLVMLVMNTPGENAARDWLQSTEQDLHQRRSEAIDSI